jgi:tetratricopeptide (TPR) repeat protein
VQALAERGHAAERFRRWTLDAGAARVDYNGEAAMPLDLRFCASMLLRQARTFQCAMAEREGHKPNETPAVCLSVPDAYSEAQTAALCDAARMANLSVVGVVTTSEALAQSLASSRAGTARGAAAASEEHVMFVDIGHTCTSVSISSFSSASSSTSKSAPTVSTLAVQSSAAIGARDIDASLFAHVTSHLSANDGSDVAAKSKSGASVLRECEKAKKVLSTIPATEMFLEQFNGARVKLRRADVESACAGAIAKLRALIEAALAEAGLDKEKLSSVEMSGGGARVPCYRDAVAAVVGSAGKLTTTLSPEAVAQGAASVGALVIAAQRAVAAEVDRRERAVLRKKEEAARKKREQELFAAAAKLKAEEAAVKAAQEGDEAGEVASAAAAAAAEAPSKEARVEEGEAAVEEEEPELPPLPTLPPSSVPATRLSPDELAAALQQETEMCAVDAELKRIEDARNQLESYIYEMQGVVEGRGKYAHHAGLLDKDSLSPLFEKAQQELWDAPEDADEPFFVEKFASLKSAFEASAPAYLEAVQKEQEAEEAAMRQAEKEAEEERKANGEDDDHDRRKLKSGDRMRLVIRNKDEATELFKGKNYAHAAARYTKSLGHCSKFVDMTPDVKEEVAKVKLSLYLNLAMCYMKLEAWTKVVPNCKDALSFDENNVKALYRRGKAYFKLKKIDDANKDVKRALKLVPEDKNLLNLKKHIDASIRKAKAKEKKMAQAMFGGN